MKNFYHYLTLLLILWVLFGTAVIIYFQQLDGAVFGKAITFTGDTNNLETDKASYRVGEMVSVKFSYCRNRSFTVTTQWKIVNEYEVNYATMSYIVPKECVTNKFYPIGVIPTDAVRGTHRLKGTTDALVNPIHHIFFNYQSAPFQVI